MILKSGSGRFLGSTVLSFARNPDAGSADATRMQTNDYHITIIFPHSRHLHPGVGIIIELVQSGQIFLLDSY
jgi:hypothetical protein